MPTLAIPHPEVPIRLTRSVGAVVITNVSQFEVAKEALNARRWVRGTQLQIVPHTFSRRSTLLSLRRA